jgi:hypothetical protein
LALGNLNLQLIQEVPQVAAGNPQFLGQPEGCGAGHFALRGRGPEFGPEFFLGHNLPDFNRSIWDYYLAQGAEKCKPNPLVVNMFIKN